MFLKHNAGYSGDILNLATLIFPKIWKRCQEKKAVEDNDFPDNVINS